MDSYSLRNLVPLGARQQGLLFAAQNVDGQPVLLWKTTRFTVEELDQWYALAGPPPHWWGLEHVALETGTVTLVSLQMDAVAADSLEGSAGMPSGDAPAWLPEARAVIFPNGECRWQTLPFLQPLVSATAPDYVPDARLGTGIEGPNALELPTFRGSWRWRHWRQRRWLAANYSGAPAGQADTPER